MNRRTTRLMTAGCVVMAGAFVSLSVDTWAMAAEPTPSPTATASASASPTVDCKSLKPGDAWAGVSLACPPAPSSTPTASALPKPIATTAATPAATPVVIPTATATIPAPTQKSAATTAATTPIPAIEEDDPAWDCHTMGNKVCGPTLQPWLADAWNSFDGKRVAESVGPENAAQAFDLTYAGTYSTEPHWPGYVVVASKVYLGIFHAFKISYGN